MSQKIALFITTGVKTSDPTNCIYTYINCICSDEALVSRMDFELTEDISSSSAAASDSPTAAVDWAYKAASLTEGPWFKSRPGDVYPEISLRVVAFLVTKMHGKIRT
jgi:hypothetical protein